MELSNMILKRNQYVPGIKTKWWTLAKNGNYTNNKMEILEMKNRLSSQ